MKKIPLFIMALFGACLLTSCTRPAVITPRSYVIGIPTDLSSDMMAAINHRIQSWVCTKLEPGSSVEVLDSCSLQHLCTIDIPEGRLGSNPMTRMKKIAPALALLDQITSQPRAAAPPPPGRTRLPQFLEYVGVNLHNVCGIIIIGDCRYREAPYSMIHGYCPNDPHLLVGRDLSDYSTKDKGQLLNGIKVYVVCPFPDQDIYDSDFHRYAVTRFWHLYVQSMSGCIAYYGNSLDDALGLVDQSAQDKSDLQENKPNYQLAIKDDEEPMMIKVDREPQWITQTTADQFQKTSFDGGHSGPAPFSIGVRWNDPVDVDLYVKAHPTAKEVYYAIPRSTEFEHHEDVRSGSEQRWEYVDSRIDLSLNDLRRVQGYLNLYSGTPPPEGVKCDVRITYGPSVFTAHLVIHARHGNQGRDRDGDRDNQYWVKIPIAQMIGLTSQDHAN